MCIEKSINCQNTYTNCDLIKKKTLDCDQIILEDMALKAALALWNIIDANDQKTPEDIVSVNSNASPKISILTLSTNSYNTVNMHDICDVIGPTEYAILDKLPSCLMKTTKRTEPEVQLIHVLKLGKDCTDTAASSRREQQLQQNEQTYESRNKQEFIAVNQHSTSLQAENPQTVFYQGRNMLELDVHLRTSWMSFNPSQVDCNNMSVEEFLLNRGQISRIVDIWPPECYLKCCPIKDCDFAEYLYQ